MQSKTYPEIPTVNVSKINNLTHSKQVKTNTENFTNTKTNFLNKIQSKTYPEIPKNTKTNTVNKYNQKMSPENSIYFKKVKTNSEISRYFRNVKTNTENYLNTKTNFLNKTQPKTYPEKMFPGISSQHSKVRTTSGKNKVNVRKIKNLPRSKNVKTNTENLNTKTNFLNKIQSKTYPKIPKNAKTNIVNKYNQKASPKNSEKMSLEISRPKRTKQTQIYPEPPGNVNKHKHKTYPKKYQTKTNKNTNLNTHTESKQTKNKTINLEQKHIKTHITSCIDTGKNAAEKKNPGKTMERATPVGKKRKINETQKENKERTNEVKMQEAKQQNRGNAKNNKPRREIIEEEEVNKANKEEELEEDQDKEQDAVNKEQENKQKEEDEVKEQEKEHKGNDDEQEANKEQENEQEENDDVKEQEKERKENEDEDDRQLAIYNDFGKDITEERTEFLLKMKMPYRSWSKTVDKHENDRTKKYRKYNHFFTNKAQRNTYGLIGVLIAGGKIDNDKPLDWVRNYLRTKGYEYEVDANNMVVGDHSNATMIYFRSEKVAYRLVKAPTEFHTILIEGDCDIEVQIGSASCTYDPTYTVTMPYT